MVGIEDEEAGDSVDASFPDRAWTLPHRVDLAHSLRIASANRDDIVITHVVRKKPGHGMTEPQATSEAFSARVYLDGIDACDVWRDGRPVPSASLEPGAMLINDMRHAWKANPTSPFNTVNFYIPQGAIDEIADEQGAGRGSELRCPTDTGWADHVFRDLALSVLPALALPDQTNRLFTDHLSRAAIAHLTARYGSLKATSRPARSGLAPWQERRAKEMLTADLSGDISLAELASACRLSPGHFSQSFKRSVGCPPHRWLLKQRIERAKHLMLTSRQPLCEIAIDTGFADQSHLTRVFTQQLGTSPGAWRRAQAA
jgi:AraC-like DNA-binding protein